MQEAIDYRVNKDGLYECKSYVFVCQGCGKEVGGYTRKTVKGRVLCRECRKAHVKKTFWKNHDTEVLDKAAERICNKFNEEWIVDTILEAVAEMKGELDE